MRWRAAGRSPSRTRRPFATGAPAEVEAQVHLVEILVKRDGNAEDASPQEPEADHRDVRTALPVVEFGARRNERLQGRRVHFVVDHEQVPPFGVEEGAGWGRILHRWSSAGGSSNRNCGSVTLGSSPVIERILRRYSSTAGEGSTGRQGWPAIQNRMKFQTARIQPPATIMVGVGPFTQSTNPGRIQTSRVNRPRQIRSQAPIKARLKTLVFMLASPGYGDCRGQTGNCNGPGRMR